MNVLINDMVRTLNRASFVACNSDRADDFALARLQEAAASIRRALEYMEDEDELEVDAAAYFDDIFDELFEDESDESEVDYEVVEDDLVVA